MGSDVPLKKAGRLVTSLACQLPCQSTLQPENGTGDEVLRQEATDQMILASCGAADGASRATTDEMAHLGVLMRELAAELIGVAFLVAQLCDTALQRQQLAYRLQHTRTPPFVTATAEDIGPRALLLPAASHQRACSPAALEAEPHWRGNAQDHALDVSRDSPAGPGTALSPGIGLAEAIRRGGTAKARLIHYHTIQDSSPQARPKRTSAPEPDPQCRDETDTPPSLLPPERLWQQWHYDYGLFTALVSPTYCRTVPDASDDHNDTGSRLPAFSCGCSSETAAQPEAMGCEGPSQQAPPYGLHVLCRQCKQLLRVEVPPDCVAIQVSTHPPFDVSPWAHLFWMVCVMHSDTCVQQSDSLDSLIASISTALYLLVLPCTVQNITGPYCTVLLSTVPASCFVRHCACRARCRLARARRFFLVASSRHRCTAS